MDSRADLKVAVLYTSLVMQSEERLARFSDELVVRGPVWSDARDGILSYNTHVVYIYIYTWLCISIQKGKDASLTALHPFRIREFINRARLNTEASKRIYNDIYIH